MDNILPIIIIIAIVATFGVLILGFIAMARGGNFNRKYGNLLMRVRIIAQGATVVLILFYILWRFS